VGQLCRVAPLAQTGRVAQRAPDRERPGALQRVAQRRRNMARRRAGRLAGKHIAQHRHPLVARWPESLPLLGKLGRSGFLAPYDSRNFRRMWRLLARGHDIENTLLTCGWSSFFAYRKNAFSRMHSNRVGSVRPLRRVVLLLSCLLSRIPYGQHHAESTEDPQKFGRMTRTSRK
jgi:hypothetical protein